MNEFKMKVGTFTGAAAAQNLDLGFVPDFFQWWNNEASVEAEVGGGRWNSAMTDGDAILDVLEAANASTATVTPYFETTNGITKLDTTKKYPDQWKASTTYAVGDIVHPSTNNGYFYRCTTAGASNSTEPTWGTTLAGTTTDNAATWTCVSPSDYPVKKTALKGLTIGSACQTNGNVYAYVAIRGN